jgi:SAM-dependent methyltransferase
MMQMTTPQEKDATFHNIIAKDYDELVKKPRDIANKILFKKVPNYFPAERNTMLDLGCGTGHATTRFGGNFKNILLVDHSNKMLDQAVANAKLAGVNATYETIEDNAFHFLANYTNTFDFIACIGFLHHIMPSERIELLSLIKQRMKTNSRLLITEPVEIPHTEPKAIAWWNNQYRKRFEVPWTADIEPDEGPINLNDLRNEFEQLDLHIEYQIQSWELLPRYNNSFRDIIGINVLSKLYPKDGPIYAAVLRKT